MNPVIYHRCFSRHVSNPQLDHQVDPPVGVPPFGATLFGASLGAEELPELQLDLLRRPQGPPPHRARGIRGIRGQGRGHGAADRGGCGHRGRLRNTRHGHGNDPADILFGLVRLYRPFLMCLFFFLRNL